MIVSQGCVGATINNLFIYSSDMALKRLLLTSSNGKHCSIAML